MTAEAIAGIEPDPIPAIAIVAIVGMVNSDVSIWSLWSLTDFSAIVAIVTIKWTPGFSQATGQNMVIMPVHITGPPLIVYK